jgi:hypothetical protein
LGKKKSDFSAASGLAATWATRARATHSQNVVDDIEGRFCKVSTAYGTREQGPPVTVR